MKYPHFAEQHHCHTAAFAFTDLCAQLTKKRLDVLPLNVAAGGVGKDKLKGSLMPALHDSYGTESWYLKTQRIGFLKNKNTPSSPPWSVNSTLNDATPAVCSMNASSLRLYGFISISGSAGGAGRSPSTARIKAGARPSILVVGAGGGRWRWGLPVAVGVIRLGVGDLNGPDAVIGQQLDQPRKQAPPARHVDVLKGNARVHQIKAAGHGRQGVVRRQQLDVGQAVQIAVAPGFGQHVGRHINAHHRSHPFGQRHRHTAHAAAEIKRAGRLKGRVDQSATGVEHVARMPAAGVKERLLGLVVEFAGTKPVVGDNGEVGVLLTPLHPFDVGAHCSVNLTTFMTGYTTENTMFKNFCNSALGALLMNSTSLLFIAKLCITKKLLGFLRSMR